MSLFLDGVLALGKSIPEFDGFVTGARHDLPIVGGKGHAHDVLGVILKATSGLAGRQVPKTKGFVPGTRKREVAVRGEHHIGDEVTMTMQPLGWDSVVRVIPGELPDDERLVPGGRQDHLGKLGIGGDLGDPTVVSGQGPTELQGFGHDGGPVVQRI